MDKNKKHFAIIGDPVEHSRSPELYAPMFEKSGIDADFQRIRVLPDELDGIRETVRAHALNGFAVTMPHKKAILPLLDDSSAFAKRAGSVNIVCCENGLLIGTLRPFPLAVETSYTQGAQKWPPEKKSD